VKETVQQHSPKNSERSHHSDGDKPAFTPLEPIIQQKMVPIADYNGPAGFQP